MKRIRFFDIAKGIAILAVILGHSAIEANLFMPHRTAQIIVSICFSFHMPLFFILSGYFMHPERKFRWAKESKQLLCTYAVTALCVLIGVTCMATLNHESRVLALRPMGHGCIIWKWRRFRFDVMASGFSNWCDLVPVGIILGASFTAFFCETSLYLHLGDCLFPCRLWFVSLCVVAMEHSSGNVRSRVSLSWLSC